MTALQTAYLGLELRTPLVASPSPATGKLDTLLRLEDAGVGAVVLPSLFEEEVESEAITFHERRETGAGVSGEAMDYFPDVDLDHLGLERHVLLVEEAVERLEIPVIASVNGRSAGGWVRYAQDLVSAGAQAIELNMYDVAVDPELSSSDVERGYLELVAAVCDAVEVPVAVKLSPVLLVVRPLRRPGGGGRRRRPRPLQPLLPAGPRPRDARRDPAGSSCPVPASCGCRCGGSRSCARGCPAPRSRSRPGSPPGPTSRRDCWRAPTSS